MNPLTKRQVSILEAMAVYPYITGEQVTRYKYADTSLRSVLWDLYKLLDEDEKEGWGYVDRKPLPSQIQRGSVPYVYWLSAKGRHYLTKQFGYDFSGWRPPHKMKLAESSHIWHALAINDFLLAGGRVAKIYPNIKRVTVKHDLVMQMTMKFPLLVKSDGWQLFHIRKMNNIEEQAIWLELDRGKESEAQWRDKVERLITYTRYGNYARDFETPIITIAVVVPPDIENAARRISNLCLWTEKKISEMGLDDKEYGEQDLFRFLVLPERYDEGWLYTEPVWHRPFSKRKHRLLDV